MVHNAKCQDVQHTLLYTGVYEGEGMGGGSA